MSIRARLTYAFDAYCGWCYGFGPALRTFANENADRVDLRVLSGGLFTGASAQPIGAFPHIPGANERIADLTGVTFGDAYQQVLAEGIRVMDSTDSATGLVALRKQAPERELELAGALQRAWYVDGRDLSDVQVYRDIATELGLDPDATAAAYKDPASRAEAQQEFRELRRLGVDSYPTLLLHTDTGVHRLGGPVSRAATLTEALDRHLESAA
ncbi:DsbA family protein [Ornithinimicrobium tianjinense]|uniref:DsbA family protein n=1 Tax=Ornithinimicrobium tianjinense TaxID=1195761 RepID=A0A917BIW7_9MICO|nr:DsbA family protein [Ornithinimicrobium tianjinense]GGF43797.1 DsbA family protein [Ornithinimicrobium tianjinense]